LPEPWLAIPHAAHTIKPNGTICSYSPCVEQTQRTTQAMRNYGFHSLKTIEVRLREHYVDDVELESVPTVKLPKDLNINSFVPGQQTPTTKPVSTSPTPVPTTTDKVKESVENEGNKRPNKKRRVLCARPFASMRGHTAFLTFAFAGNTAYPDPTKSSQD
jgi:tRNA (adenine57-N1/adenine58-N1)-methyltransferase